MAAKIRKWLLEDVARNPNAHRVDRDAGIIYGVKVLGFESVNGRTYARKAVVEGKRFYDGLAVNINHPKKATDPRLADDRFGRLINPRVEPDGLYADLEYLKTHPMAERICEAAERMPEVFGLSHNAQGDVEVIEGKDVVQRILEVRSVDIVSDPATTGGLFEQRRGNRMKIRTFLESVLKAFKLPRAGRKKLKPLLEDDYMDADMPLEDDGEEPAPAEAGDDHVTALKKGFRAAINAILDDDTLDASAQGKKIQEYLKTHEKLSSKDAVVGEDEDVEEEEDEDKKTEDTKEGEEECDTDKKKEKAMEQRLRTLEKEKLARDLCEEAGIQTDREFVSILTETTSTEAMKKLVTREKARGKTRRPAPRSGNSQPLTENVNGTETVEGQLSLLRN